MQKRRESFQFGKEDEHTNYYFLLCQSTLPLSGLIMELSVAALLVLSLACHSSLALNNGLALSPPMGWSSWNHYHRKYNESVFYANAKAMASNGMKDVGYEYINIDGGWWAGADTGHAQRNATGFMQVNAEKFPNGIPKLVDYVHSLGLKWGHYTDAGSHFCNRDEPASYGYEEQDAKLFVSFGADMVKIDACGSTTEQHEPTMAKWARLFNESGRPVLVSNCHNGCQTNAWFDWCPQSANMWRSSSDINDSWKSIMSNLHTLVERGAYGGPGRWNDPDFLEVGNSGLSHDEAVAHFSLWCVTSSPLIAGNDLTSMDAATLAIYTNKVAISVNQRYLNSSGDRVMVNGTLEVRCRANTTIVRPGVTGATGQVNTAPTL
eukprot:scpid90346/ scgid2356/ Alpha-galactosidase; Alpha-D-galactoside galactohydrolase; Melibiase